jgi:hypothetical protein
MELLGFTVSNVSCKTIIPNLKYVKEIGCRIRALVLDDDSVPELLDFVFFK